jgi:hypothetical protein
MARTYRDNHHLMTGDDLVTLVTEAPSAEEAARIAKAAPVNARYGACDLLYLDAESHGMPWIIRNIVSEARA